MPDPIDTADIGAAEKLVGVAYTEAEREAMHDSLGAQVELAKRRRAVPLPRDLPPATWFDPRQPG